MSATPLVRTPEPPYYAVIFSSRRVARVERAYGVADQ